MDRRCIIFISDSRTLKIYAFLQALCIRYSDLEEVTKIASHFHWSRRRNDYCTSHIVQENDYPLLCLQFQLLFVHVRYIKVWIINYADLFKIPFVFLMTLGLVTMKLSLIITRSYKWIISLQWFEGAKHEKSDAKHSYSFPLYLHYFYCDLLHQDYALVLCKVRDVEHSDIFCLFLSCIEASFRNNRKSNNRDLHITFL